MRAARNRRGGFWIALALTVGWLAGCGPTSTPAPTPIPSTEPSPAPSATPSPQPTLTPSLTPPAELAWPAVFEPAGCQAPPENYARVELGSWVVNRRTQAMLEHAARLYGGEMDLAGAAITQGSYHDNGAASFGTHLGGGAVDLSVIRLPEWVVLWDEIEPALRALRAAGFAAWLREYGELSPDSPIHIHAVAVGDAELSAAAEAQLTGEAGYFRGYDGLPAQFGAPRPDRFGGPVVCAWMRAKGYEDLRPPEARVLPTALPNLTPGQSLTYAVEPGDTLPAVAARFGTRPEAVARRNHLTRVDALTVGQTLEIVVGE